MSGHVHHRKLIQLETKQQFLEEVFKSVEFPTESKLFKFKLLFKCDYTSVISFLTMSNTIAVLGITLVALAQQSFEKLYNMRILRI